ncbi:MAG: hypothetical protein IT379_01125 [Deltaproteobacteria bacterium]|nr:hypothetical protein [Deltaproteobacteria bacterium]
MEQPPSSDEPRPDRGGDPASAPARAREPAPPTVPAATFAFAAAAVAVLAGGLVLASSGVAGPWPWAVAGASVLVIALVAWRLHTEQVLTDLVRYRPGDVLRGGATGALVFAACAAIVHGIVPTVPALSRDLATLDPAVAVVGRNLAFVAALAVGVAQQLLMRGLVHRAIASRAGAARAVAITAVVEALVWLASGHPALVILALLVGVGCGVLQVRSGRVLPSLLAHAMVVFLLSTFPVHGPR